jgi:hypothetical protein
MEHNMKSVITALIVTVGIQGLSAAGALADKTKSSDPAPSTTSQSNGR